MYRSLPRRVQKPINYNLVQNKNDMKEKRNIIEIIGEK